MMFLQQLAIRLRGAATMILAALMLFLATGAMHGHCANGDHGADAVEQFDSCKCCCHHPPNLPDGQSVSRRCALAIVVFASDPGGFVSDTTPLGVFHPPKHLA